MMKGREKYPELLKWLNGGPEGFELNHIGVGYFLVNLIHPTKGEQENAVASMLKCISEDYRDEDFFCHLRNVSVNCLVYHFDLNLSRFRSELYVMAECRVIGKSLAGYARIPTPVKTPNGGRELLSEEPPVFPTSGLNIGDKIKMWDRCGDVIIESDPFMDNLARTIQAEINLYAQTHEIEEI